MKSKLESQFNRVSISEKDFDEAITYLDEWDGLKNDVQRQAVLTAAIVAYSRPFFDSEDGGKSTKKLSERQAHIGDLQKTLHKKIFDLRRNAVAHSDFNFKAVRRVKGQSNGFLTMSRPFHVLSEGISIPEFQALCIAQKAECRRKLFELNRKICGAE